MADVDIATLTVMRGELERLPGLLENIAFASERHFVETGPTTEGLRGVDGIVVHHHPLPLGAAFDAARGTALPHIKARWVLVVDTDERIPPSLVEHLRVRVAEFEAAGVEGVWIARRNHVLGQPLLHSSAWPDYQLRFLRRDAAAFSNQIHGFAPKLKREERLAAMDALAIQHFNFETTTDFLTKLNVYSGIEAEQSKEAASPSVTRALYKASREFAVRYLKMKGYRDGAEGLHFAVMLGMYRYLIESKRWERRR
jgi:glycosyltransferase involved in cell wall biosynthesis